MPLFALSLFVAASLLFCVQPMVAKMVLPLAGGSPAVWNACMVFFQSALLAGYAYADASTRRLGVRRQALAQVAIILLAGLTLPFAFDRASTGGPVGGADPTGWLLATLLRTVGPAFFVVATTAPLLQRWFAGTGHKDSADPYFLYGASNLGSLLALLAYPLLIEPRFRLADQARGWAIGYAAMGLLVAACAAAAWRSSGATVAEPEGPAERVDAGRWLAWAGLAFVPSSLLLGLTSYLSTDIAPIPLLWVVPLSLYLLSFIVAFARRPIPSPRWAGRALPFASLVVVFALSGGLVKLYWIPFHLLAFSLAALACHGRLASLRPGARHLTGFYLAMSVGGAAGGVFNALIAPMVFDRAVEYPLGLTLALLAMPATGWPRAAGGKSAKAEVEELPEMPGPSRPIVRDLARLLAIPAAVLGLTSWLVTRDSAWSSPGPPLWGAVAASILASGLGGLAIATCWTRPARFALTVGAALLATGLTPSTYDRVIHRQRNFYGATKVSESRLTGRFHSLSHGSTLHGLQDRDPAQRREPLTYYHRAGPVGQVFDELMGRGKPLSIAVVGLGTGSTAAYPRPVDALTYYEIDPAIVRIAENSALFTYLQDCRVRPKIILGDARLRLAEAPARGYDLIALDAFSSDAVPVHLLTREALELYRSKLAPGGIILFHISNRYLDLEPMLGALARDAGMSLKVGYLDNLSEELEAAGASRSTWVAMVERRRDLGGLDRQPKWRPPHEKAGARGWTDDFSNILDAVRYGPRR